ncbi:PREDICTED: uncharacterized protein LOC106317074 isoform X1 [Brassica oleracea var. oleracea]|uniref:uncharacterized protein LOC106317074 isoform X1 n=1 Tax=Brassica oleracea var. oleracea TaxID=109376 RepID=UPI0006A72C7A|nr:PREDICTED: uncharacterized protein LOC106317074 isoform X1 [Brassica oleracea var. oleracea]
MVARCMVEIIPRLQGMSREIDQMKIPMIYSIMISFVDVNSGPESLLVKDGFVVSGSGSAEKVVRLWEMISEETKEKRIKDGNKLLVSNWRKSFHMAGPLTFETKEFVVDMNDKKVDGSSSRKQRNDAQYETIQVLSVVLSNMTSQRLGDKDSQSTKTKFQGRIFRKPDLSYFCKSSFLIIILRKM